MLARWKRRRQNLSLDFGKLGFARGAIRHCLIILLTPCLGNTVIQDRHWYLPTFGSIVALPPTKTMNGNTMTVTRYRTLEEAMDEVERELNVRARCFPRWIDDGRVSKTDARDRLDRLATALTILETLHAAQDDVSKHDILATFDAVTARKGFVPNSGDMT